MTAKQALILTAGPAHRLVPLTDGRPKGMLLVGGQPLLQHMVAALATMGVEDIVMVVGQHGEKTQAFFKDGKDFGVRIRYVNQSEPTGTMAAFRLALPLLDGKKPAWILPGHAYVTPNLLKPLAGVTTTTILVATAGDGHVQGVPSVRGNRLRGMQHEAPTVGSTRVATNILVATPDFLAAAQTALGDHKDIDLALGDWSASGGVVDVAATRHDWRVLVGPWDVLRLNEWVLSQGIVEPTKGIKGARGPVRVGKNTVIAPTAVLIGPVTIGDGCTIEDHCVIGPFVAIRNLTIVGAHSEIRRSIVNNNVLVGSGALVRGCILDDGVQLGPRVLCAELVTPDGPRGCIIGRDAVVAPQTLVPGGSIVARSGT